MGKAETTKNKRDTKETLQFFDTTLQAQFKNDQIRKPNRIGDPQNVIPFHYGRICHIPIKRRSF